MQRFLDPVLGDQREAKLRRQRASERGLSGRGWPGDDDDPPRGKPGQHQRQPAAQQAGTRAPGSCLTAAAPEF